MEKGLEMDNLSVSINKVLAQYTSDVNMTIQSTIDTTARDAAQRLRAESARTHGNGKYAKNWAVKKERGRAVIYNKAPTYRLTHLLENGHDIIRDGKKVGEYRPREKHIKPVEEWVQDEVQKRLEEALGNVD